MSKATGTVTPRSRRRGAPGRPRVPRAERARQMLATAERVFAERGFDAASMDEIAELLTQLMTGATSDEGIDSQLAATHLPPLAHALTGATIGLANWWLEHPEEPKELQALRLMNFAWMGFGDILNGELWLPQAPA